MNNLTKFFPLSAKFSNTGGQLAAGIAIYLGSSIVIGTILGILIFVISFLLGLIPYLGIVLAILVGAVLGFVNFLVGVYCLAGIIIEILMFTKAIK